METEREQPAVDVTDQFSQYRGMGFIGDCDEQGGVVVIDQQYLLGCRKNIF